MELLTKLAVITGPVAGYISQYYEISKQKSSKGFSHSICGVMLAANISRIAFWVGKRFDSTLLYQSIVMIIAQLFLLEICVRYIPKSVAASASKQFWGWSRLTPYLLTILQFSVAISILTFIFYDNREYFELMGMVSLCIESGLGFPQVYNNYKRKTSQGFSFSLLFTWFAGDLYKMGYFYTTSAPYQFMLCAAIQLLVDFVILFQILLYH